MELEMDCLTSICTKSAHPQGWSLKFISCDGWAKYKEKVLPNVSDLNQNVETTY